MANRLPSKKRREIFDAIYKKADAFGYMECGRIDSGRFMDELVEDPEIGGKLADYMQKERIRTYIKDTVLNRYTKKKKEEALALLTPEKTIKEVYGVDAAFIDKIALKGNRLDILRSEDGCIFVVSNGTALKWETALRKALETIANKPNLTVDNKAPFVCLKLSVPGQMLTDADKKLIRDALGAVSVKAVFCEQ